jgi:hypothetical protein
MTTVQTLKSSSRPFSSTTSLDRPNTSQRVNAVTRKPSAPAVRSVVSDRQRPRTRGDPTGPGGGDDSSSVANSVCDNCDGCPLCRGVNRAVNQVLPLSNAGCKWCLCCHVGVAAFLWSPVGVLSVHVLHESEVVCERQHWHPGPELLAAISQHSEWCHAGRWI